MPGKRDEDCLMELRRLYDPHSAAEARAGLAAWLERRRAKYPKLTAWAEENTGETFAFHSLPGRHRRHLKPANMPGRVNQEIRRRARIIRVFPNAGSCLRPVRAPAAGIRGDWREGVRCLNMDFLKERQRESLRKAA